MSVFFVFWVVFWNGYVHTQREKHAYRHLKRAGQCLLSRTAWTAPGDTHVFLHWQWKELSWGTWTFSCLKVGQINSSSPPHPLLDADNISLLWHSCQPASVPHDTAEDWGVCVGLPMSVRQQEARWAFPLAVLSPVSQAMVRLVTAHTSGCSGSSDGRGRCTSGAWEHVWECSTSLLLVSVPLMGVPLNVGPTLSHDLQLHRRTMVPSLQSDAAAWWGEAAGVFLAPVWLEWEADVLCKCFRVKWVKRDQWDASHALFCSLLAKQVRLPPVLTTKCQAPFLTNQKD